MAGNTIGLATCAICGSQKARAGVSASGLAYITCNACNSQTFARSARSDEHLRRLVRVSAPAPAAPPNVAAAPAAPVPASVPAANPVETPETANQSRNKWEIF